MSFIQVAIMRVVVGVGSALLHGAGTLGFMLWDTSVAIFNLVTFGRPANKVVRQGFADANGLWPQYMPAQEGDIRCSCPAINAMANHGILPHSGRGITFRQLTENVRKTYNFSTSFSYFVSHHAAEVLCRSYWTGEFDLSDIDTHNGIEHDASLCREDAAFEPDQSKIAVHLIEELLASGTGPNGDLTPADLSRVLGKRRTECKAKNSKYCQPLSAKIFGSANGTTLLTTFGGKVKDLRSFLLEERIPDGWQPRARQQLGLTFAELNSVAIKVELGIKEELPGSRGSSKKVD